MKKAFLLLLFLTSCLTSVFSQTENDSILSKKVFLGYKYYTKDINLNSKQVREIVSNDGDTEKQLKLAEIDDVCSNAFCYVGGFTLGYTITTSIIDGTFLKPYYYVCAFGLGCIITGGFFAKLSDNHIMNAVNIYNAKIGGTALNNVELSFGLNPGGIGFTLSF